MKRLETTSGGRERVLRSGRVGREEVVTTSRNRAGFPSRVDMATASSERERERERRWFWKTKRIRAFGPASPRRVGVGKLEKGECCVYTPVTRSARFG